jgi:hypothetical protein
MKLYTAPEKVPDNFHMNTELIFLAGSIEQGTAKDWQPSVIEALRHIDCVVFNPRRLVWDPTIEQSASNLVFAEQVNWELDQLEWATIAFFYFQAGTQSPVTLAEFGKMIEMYGYTDVMLVVVCEPGFWRKGNVDIMCTRAGVEPFETLEDGVQRLLELAQPED